MDLATSPLDLEEPKTRERETGGASSPCRTCDVLRDATFCADLSPDDLRRLGSNRCHAHLSAGTTLFHEGEAAEHLYSLATGTVKLYRLMSDGRRQIIDFLFSGDIFGLSVDGAYAYTAETVSPSRICRFAQRKIDLLRDSIPRMERKMYAMALRELAEAQDQMLLLGRKTAREKLATFLLRLARRGQDQGLALHFVPLPMSRADIADYLGLTIETVSRTFSQFKRESVIALPATGHAVIQDPEALRALADGTAPV
jgi:CRP/FNR family transcriptional regulator, anaerobic regulatory protein